MSEERSNKRKRLFDCLVDSTPNKKLISLQECQELMALISQDVYGLFGFRWTDLPKEMWVLIMQFLWDESYGGAALIPQIHKSWNVLYLDHEKDRFDAFLCTKKGQRQALLLTMADCLFSRYVDCVQINLFVSKTTPRTFGDHVILHLIFSSQKLEVIIHARSPPARRATECALGWENYGCVTRKDIIQKANLILDPVEGFLDGETIDLVIPIKEKRVMRLEPLPQGHVFETVIGRDIPCGLHITNINYFKNAGRELKESVYNLLLPINKTHKMW